MPAWEGVSEQLCWLCLIWGGLFGVRDPLGTPRSPPGLGCGGIALGDEHPANNRLNKKTGLFKMPSASKWDFQFLKAGGELVWSQSLCGHFPSGTRLFLHRITLKMCCRETLSFVSMTLQISPNKFDASQSVPAFIPPNKSFSPSTRSPGLAGAAGMSPSLTCQGQARCPRCSPQLFQGVSLQCCP